MDFKGILFLGRGELTCQKLRDVILGGPVKILQLITKGKGEV